MHNYIERAADETIAGLSATDIEATLADVWACLRSGEAAAPLDDTIGEPISAAADIHGDVENRSTTLHLMVTVDQQAAGLLVAAFFGANRQSNRGEVNDAVGELANMCAGAVKTLLEGDWVIGLPHPADEATGRAAGWVQATLTVRAGWIRLAVGPGADFPGRN